MISENSLRALARRLTAVPGIVGVTLGGSRARGDHLPESDVDLGLYYRPPLDVAALGDLAREVAGTEVALTQPGEWGPWVDGGGWLRIADTAVDWIYRDLDRVHAAWDDAREGRSAFHFQVGHPLGVPDFAYPGELALGVVLADPTGELAALRRHLRYPRALADALVDRLWEAEFSLKNASKAVTRADTAYVAGCLFWVVGLCAHALHGRAGRWLVNEKGAVIAAGRLANAPSGFSQRAAAILAHLGTEPEELEVAVRAAAQLLIDVRTACRVSGP